MILNANLRYVNESAVNIITFILCPFLQLHLHRVKHLFLCVFISLLFLSKNSLGSSGVIVI